jgi:hemerythrin-like metal-binding protein
MNSRENRFQTCGDQLEILDNEHTEIRRQYIELDDAILQGEGSARILEAAAELAQTMGTHFTHEEEFQETNLIPVFEKQSSTGRATMAEIMMIAQRLQQGEVYAALRLRGLCKGWMHEHMYVENVEFGIASLAFANESDRIRAQI